MVMILEELAMNNIHLLKFMDYLKNISKKIIEMGKDDPIYVFSHIDADGLTAVSILIYLLTKLNKPFIVNFLPQIIPSEFQSTWDDIRPRYAIFVDLGTDVPNKILSRSSSIISGIIIDHHIFEASNPQNYSYIANSRIFGIDGGTEISSSGISFLLANSFSTIVPRIRNLISWSIIGALGDSQDIGPKRNLVGLNSILVEHAKRSNILKETTDLLLIGRGIRPLYQLLAETFVVDIPGVTGSYDGAADFLKKHGIIRSDDELEKLYLDDLPANKKEFLKKKIIEMVMLHFAGKFTIENLDSLLTGTTYEFLNTKLRLLKYGRDVAVLLNACGKMKKPHIGVQLLLEKEKTKILDTVISLYNRYRALISSSLKNFENNIRTEKNISIFDGRDFLHEELASTISSILATKIESQAVIVISRSVGDILKISVRKPKSSNIPSLGEIIKKIAEKLPSVTGGGHENAAGAYVREQEYDKFERLFISFCGDYP